MISKLFDWLPAIGLLLVGVVAYFKGKSSQRKNDAIRAAKDSRKINDADTKVAQMADDDVRNSLRSWVRNDDD